MPTATLATKTFTPLSGGETQVIPDAPSAHTKAGSIWNRLKSRINGAVVNFSEKAPDNKLGRDANGNFWKIGPANAYIKELETVIEGSGKTPTPKLSVELEAVAELTRENKELRDRLGALQKAPSTTKPSAAPTPAKPSVHLIEVATAVLGKEKVQHFARTLSTDQCLSVLERNLYMLHVKAPGIDLSRAASLCGEPPKLFGMYRAECASAQKRVNALLESKGIAA